VIEVKLLHRAFLLMVVGLYLAAISSPVSGQDGLRILSPDSQSTAPQSAGGSARPAPEREAVTGAAAALWDDLYATYRPLLVRELEELAIDQPADLYKFLYQGVMGPAHADVSEAAALSWLQREWQQILAQSGKAVRDRLPLCVPLRPDSQLVRIHLEPLAELVTAGVPPTEREQILALTWERLALAFSRTATTWAPDLRMLRGLWERIVADHPLWVEHFTPQALADFTREVNDAGWPPVHHSDAFRTTWDPHYRVVARSQLPPTWTRLWSPGDSTRE